MAKAEFCQSDIKLKTTKMNVMLFTDFCQNVPKSPDFPTKTSKENALVLNEPPRGKTNNVVSEQVRHKPVCTVTEAG